jgi:hypothetical protein
MGVGGSKQKKKQKEENIYMLTFVTSCRQETKKKEAKAMDG